MKIVCISDSHNQHENIILPEGDMIIHSGDLTGIGTTGEVMSFLEWFKNLDFKYKIFIAGNHDWLFEHIANDDPKNPQYTTIEKIVPEGVIYLNDSGIEIEGLKIWGSPIQPWFHSWAFNRRPGKEIQQHWDLIPEGLDILITHGPPLGILDKNRFNEPCGCRDLRIAVVDKKPKVHVFGHIHESHGLLKQGSVTYINASVLNDFYKMVYEPIEIIIN